MNLKELREDIASMERQLGWLKNINQNCMGCDHRTANNVCRKHGLIPENFLNVGCEDWVWDDVPF